MFEAGEEVAVVDGDHDLRAESSGCGEGAGGEGDFAGADEAVEAFLRLRAEVQRDFNVSIAAVGPVGLSAPSAVGVRAAGGFRRHLSRWGWCGGWWRCS